MGTTIVGFEKNVKKMHKVRIGPPNDVKPLVIVMGRNYTTRLTLIRAAGVLGCNVVLIQTDRKKSHVLKIDQRSKFVMASHFCPEPDKHLLLDTIFQYKDYDGGGKHPLLVPADDYVAAVVDENLNRLRPFFLLPNVNNIQGEVMKIMDKGYQKTVAHAVGMSVAKGWICCFKDGKYVIPDDIKYPCFAKPLESYSAALKHLQKRCNSWMELESLLEKAAKNYRLPYLVEEFIEITKEYGVQGISLGNRAILPGVVFKERSRNGLTATGSIHPIEDIPGLRAQLLEFLKRICFTGIFDIDLFESNGQIYFNELNTRLGANGFALTYGVDNVPGLFFKYLLGQDNIYYDGPNDFTVKSFASEKVVRDMYYDYTITLKEYKKILNDADILSLKYEGDMGPYNQFIKLDKILPLWRIMRNIKKHFK
jgi:hypothetical protein